ncbi:hypothetical protein J1P26_14405 [Neobacillus sp. MM2021_6]|uniref:hypothetical protein n=1 Tax=Bacillaceae TaxID=186817 RepID=UPI00140B1C6C|nr:MULTISPECIES: hypothetical protein [Bacillaceae]MBO0960892.1 hypothetical protein [Neobacillus sp. MM2021_6]NHC21148.1 hypothetical protein [Bacillus sp. MM2020_4]
MTREEWREILPRKIISASVSATIFAIILGLINPNPFGDISVSSIYKYLFSSISIIPIYIMYSFPAILIYGVITSIISDKVGEFISIKTKVKKAEIIVSVVLHMVFGLILFWLSLGASVLFFITDRIMRRLNKQYEWMEAIKSMAIPVLSFLILMGIVWANDIFLN